jgi:hypothetical protein
MSLHVIARLLGREVAEKTARQALRHAYEEAGVRPTAAVLGEVLS